MTPAETISSESNRGERFFRDDLGKEYSVGQ